METESRQKKLEKLRKFWKIHLEIWEESGLNQSEYCRQHNLIYHRFVFLCSRNKLTKIKSLSQHREQYRKSAPVRRWGLLTAYNFDTKSF